MDPMNGRVAVGTPTWLSGSGAMTEGRLNGAGPRRAEADPRTVSGS